ncbi:hypothetical protein L2E82_29292 [Cichorium intybus]|uniref:Uncharacterized protein n=1 Tax=Cichorium intybus TaxID=13427 RepID=A0ACB9CXC4_CICIN|nr:hypothetical protein L2E82_29292 [Cichorium intybus]
MVVLSELSEGSSSCSSVNAHRYDVFLSFRGLDTRHSFTDHLHKALVDANITTFLDDEEIDTGEDLKPELESAIKASRASVIILSKNYAASTWCLDELVLILEQRMTSNHIVIPIFYHVEPTHVRKQQSTFGDAMAKYKQMMETETNANKRCQWVRKMDGWNKALIEVAALKGRDINGRLETKSSYIEDISRRCAGKFNGLLDLQKQLYVLKRKKCKENLLGLALDMRMLEKEKLCASFELKTEAMVEMDNLMLLQLNYVQINGSYENFPEELRWLCMHGFSLKSIPSALQTENLVALDMSYSNIESVGICYSNRQRPQKRQKLIESCSKDKRGPEESEMQMYYEFGIFSTIYGGEDIPNWIPVDNRSN